jgi:hypothetical protein
MISTIDTITSLRRLFAKWGNDPDIATRDLICTPIKANHAMVSGYGMINYDRGLCSAATILARGAN